jgi:hypothetical protein
VRGAPEVVQNVDVVVAGDGITSELSTATPVGFNVLHCVEVDIELLTRAAARSARTRCQRVTAMPLGTN